MHLNVWTKTTVHSAKYEASAGEWVVELTRGDATKRTLKPKIVVSALRTACTHLTTLQVLATGITGSVPYLPTEVPGQADWTGMSLHSSKYKNARDFKGKKVIVVGTASTGMDVAGDLGESCRAAAAFPADRIQVATEPKSPSYSALRVTS
jgi:putative flavoprotein involved in K+ transport